MKNNGPRIIQHILFWVLAWVFLSWLFTRLTKEYSYTFLFTSLLLLIAIISTYLFNYYLIPKFLLGKKYLIFTLLSLFVVLMSLWMELLGILGIFLFLVTRSQSTGTGLPFFIDPVFLIAGLYFVILAGVMIRMIRLSFTMQADKLKLQNMTLEIENKLKASEINSLKAQFHPHFLFNTLNNLYWMTLNKSEQAPQLVLKLSDLLDYSLHQSNKDRVSLDQEIDYLRNYLEILKIRFEETANIQFSVNGSTLNRSVAPLIFIVFVENACKHGLAQITTAGWVNISFRIKPGEIHFSVANNYRSGSDTMESDKGLGLVQVQLRLQHGYPGKHELIFGKSDHEFNVELTLYD